MRRSTSEPRMVLEQPAGGGGRDAPQRHGRENPLLTTPRARNRGSGLRSSLYQPGGYWNSDNDHHITQNLHDCPDDEKAEDLKKRFILEAKQSLSKPFARHYAVEGLETRRRSDSRRDEHRSRRKLKRSPNRTKKAVVYSDDAYTPNKRALVAARSLSDSLTTMEESSMELNTSRIGVGLYNRDNFVRSYSDSYAAGARIDEMDEKEDYTVEEEDDETTVRTQDDRLATEEDFSIWAELEEVFFDCSYMLRCVVREATAPACGNALPCTIIPPLETHSKNAPKDLANSFFI